MIGLDDGPRLAQRGLSAFPIDRIDPHGMSLLMSIARTGLGLGPFLDLAKISSCGSRALGVA
jgi:hypothetical protein